MTEQPQSLRSLFVAAIAEKKSLESRTDTSTDTYRNDVDATITKFEECARLVDLLSLFSSNESIEDIATEDLQYLTLDCLLAESVQRSYNLDREALLQRASRLYEKYLTRLDDYGVLSAGDAKLFEQYVDNPSSFTIAPLNDAATRRETKVLRYKQEKELKDRLEFLSQNQHSLQANEDDIRQLRLVEIKLYAHQTFQSLDLICQELVMLSAMRNAKTGAETKARQIEEPRRRNGIDEDTYSERLDLSLTQLLRGGKLGPLLSKEGKPLQPFTLLDRRSQLQKGVFTPGHNLPTMTIDEYLDEERRRGGIIEGGNQSAAKPEVDEDDMEIADEETIRARAWDEFKEANPRGSGNTLNRG